MVKLIIFENSLVFQVLKILSEGTFSHVVAHITEGLGYAVKLDSLKLSKTIILAQISMQIAV